MVLDGKSKLWYNCDRASFPEVNVPARSLLAELVASYMPVVEEIDEALDVGFFGMNFFHVVAPLEAWTGETALVIAVAVMALIPLAMFLWIRQRIQM